MLPSAERTLGSSSSCGASANDARRVERRLLLQPAVVQIEHPAGRAIGKPGARMVPELGQALDERGALREPFQIRMCERVLGGDPRAGFGRTEILQPAIGIRPPCGRDSRRRRRPCASADRRAARSPRCAPKAATWNDAQGATGIFVHGPSLLPDAGVPSGGITRAPTDEACCRRARAEKGGSVARGSRTVKPILEVDGAPTHAMD